MRNFRAADRDRLLKAADWQVKYHTERFQSDGDANLFAYHSGALHSALTLGIEIYNTFGLASPYKTFAELTAPRVEPEARE